MEKQRPQQATLVAKDYDYERNVNLSVQWIRWLLKLFGVWSDVSPTEKRFSWMTFAVCYTLIVFEFVSCSLFLILEVDDVSGRIQMIGPLSFLAMAVTKYNLLMFHEHEIMKCMERIKWDWRNAKYTEDRNIMIVYANYGRRLVLICAFFMFSSFVFYYFVVPATTGKVRDGNQTYFQMPFPFPRLIADVRFSPAAEIVFFLQAVTGMLIHFLVTATFSVAAVFAMHACGQMQVLMSWLEHLIDGRSDMIGNVDERIASIVNQHVRILRFLAITEKALQQVSFVEFLGCTLNMCLLGYYIITTWSKKQIVVSVTYIMLIGSFTFNIFIFCYIGELVAEQCKKIGEMSYMIEWYELPGNKKLCCILIIAMSNSSIKFTAGNMVELSLNTFSDVVKTSVAFLNMLRTLT